MKIQHECEKCKDFSKHCAELSKEHIKRSKYFTELSKEHAEKCQCKEDKQ